MPMPLLIPASLPRSRHLPHLRYLPRRAAGFVLYEALIAIAIFIIGILGLVGMQTALTRSQTDSDLRANAAYLGTDLIGRMWANVNNLASYNGCGTSNPNVNTQCADWVSKVQAELPSPVASATADTTGTTGSVSIFISWRSQSGDTHSYTTSTTILSKTIN